jgi:hypothetical protein
MLQSPFPYTIGTQRSHVTFLTIKTTVRKKTGKQQSDAVISIAVAETDAVAYSCGLRMKQVSSMKDCKRHPNSQATGIAGMGDRMGLIQDM